MKKTDEQRDVDHDRMVELHHLMHTIPGPPLEWSDGNKLRYLVYRKWARVLARDDDCEKVHADRVGWDLLRIADRLDAMDAAEMQMPAL